MLGLVSLVPQPFYQQIEKIWEDLETKFDLIGFLISPIPHLSWQIAEQYQQQPLEKSIRELTFKIPPFKIRTNGLGLFTGVRQVIYIPIIKDCYLVELHQQIWQAAQPHSEGINPLYSPDFWVPHITLIHENLTAENIGPIMKYLASKSYNWEMTIDQLNLVSSAQSETSSLLVKKSFPLLG